MRHITVSTKGQIVLPKAIRDKRRWKAGTELVVEERPDGVLLKTDVRKKSGSIADLVGSLKYNGPTRTIEEMNDAIVEEVKRRHARGRY